MKPSVYALVFILQRDPRSAEILRYLLEYKVSSINQLSRELKIPYGSVYNKVKKLERYGVLKLTPGPQNSTLVTINSTWTVAVEKAIVEYSRATGTQRKRKR